jgi:hypothetical protein
MLPYERLAEDTKSSRRTIADAVDVLCSQAGFAWRDHATIHVGQMRLPSTETVGLIQILFSTPQKIFIVALPASTKLQATGDQDTSPKTFDVMRLHHATVDVDGVIHLPDGIKLKAAEVRPHRLPLNPTALDWRIVHATVKALNAEKRCYRRPTDRLPKRLRRLRPFPRPRLLRRSLQNFLFLDCSALPGLRVPALKELAYRLREVDPFLKAASDQKIASALRTFGIRIPRPRPRRATTAFDP